MRAAPAPARPPAGPPLLVLRVGAHWLALPAQAIREVVLKGMLTRLPLAPAHVLGVALLRSRVLPVISLAESLGAAANVELVPTLPRLVVVAVADGEVALVADEVRGITELPAAALRDQASPDGRPAWVAAEVSWEERLLCILDAEQLIESCYGEEARA
jgi:purine-binding chemotaxis protein CheW